MDEDLIMVEVGRPKKLRAIMGSMQSLASKWLPRYSWPTIGDRW